MLTRCQNAGVKRQRPFINAAQGSTLRSRVDVFIDKQIEIWNQTVPSAQHFEGGKINQDYYKRHLIETIWRIRLLRVAESKAIGEIAKSSPEAAQIWANYEREEMIHDTLFLNDLIAAGGSEDELMATEPYLATKLLAGYFNYLLDHEGPLGVLAYSYLVEYVNVKIDPRKIESMRREMGAKMIKGQISHSHTDTYEDHPGEVWEAIRLLLRDESDIERLMTYLVEHQRILAMYFREIHADKILASHSQETLL